MIGQTISHYKILAKLGEGGMGVVYKAEDTKLKRIVALKFLSAIALGGEEKSRFLREAQAAAALNHPNICTIYAIDEVNGQMFIAMEYIEGQSLREKIEVGPLKIDEAIKFAMQVADGLQAAHEKGITHRDIKSANIMITEKNQVKIMDFGLAKLARGGTMLTKEGMTLGTAAYMSPEQARGEVVDHRTDIWSLGVVLYEMITGRLPFRGEYEAAMMYSIMSEEPEPITALRTGVPLDLERVVGKTLAKDPAARYQHTDELSVDMKAIKAGYSRISKTPKRLVSVSNKRHLMRWVYGILFVLLGIVIGVSLINILDWKLLRPTSLTQPSHLRFIVELPSEQQLISEFSSPFAISPDGKRLVYAAQENANTKFYLREFDQFEAAPINGTEGASSPFFSPDGEWIGFFAQGQLKKVAVIGGNPLTICNTPAISLGASWGYDNNIVFTTVGTSASLLQVPSEGGTPQVLTTIDSDKDEVAHCWPYSLPDGKGVLFTIAKSREEPDIALLSLETRKLHTIIKGGAGARFLPTGHLVYSQSGRIMIVKFSLSTLQTSGSAIPILENVFTLTGSGNAYFAVSNTGTLVYVPGHVHSVEQTLVMVNRDGRSTPLMKVLGTLRTPRLSPDGKKLAVTIIDLANLNIWIYDIERKNRAKLTVGGANYFPVWSPDGTTITFASNRFGGSFNLYCMPSDGSDEAKLIFARDYNQVPTSMSPDGQILAFYETNPVTNRDIWMLVGERRDTSTIFIGTSFNERSPMFSPDGRWLAYVSNESGRDEVYVQPYPGPGGKSLISTDGGREPMWSRSGRELFYRNVDKMMVVHVETGPKFRASIPQQLFKGQFVLDPPGNPNYDVFPDGQHFVMIQSDQELSLTRFNVVINWFEELK